MVQYKIELSSNFTCLHSWMSLKICAISNEPPSHCSVNWKCHDMINGVFITWVTSQAGKYCWPKQLAMKMENRREHLKMDMM